VKKHATAFRLSPRCAGPHAVDIADEERFDAARIAACVSSLRPTRPLWRRPAASERSGDLQPVRPSPTSEFQGNAMLKRWMFALLALLLSTGAQAQFLTDPNGEFRLDAGERLQSGQVARALGNRMSADGSTVIATYTVATLHMQTDGNLVLYTLDPDTLIPRIRWTSGTQGNPGAYLEMQTDGNLVVYRTDRYPLWEARTHGYGPDAHMRLQSDGNMVVYSHDALWASNSWRHGMPYSGIAPKPIERMVRGDIVYSPNNRFYLILQQDHNLVLYQAGGGALWATGSRGDVAVVQGDGNFVLYDGYQQAVWASNTNGYGPSVELLLQDDGNLVLYGYKARWSPDKDRAWYDKLCDLISCKVRYKESF
jgi:hypothetical protein